MTTGGAGEAPLIAGKIHGVRGWTLLGGRLCAAVHADEWAAAGRPTRATCRASAGHRSPAKHCGCGLYGTHPWAAETMGGVVGVIEAWGRVELHRTGFRAERARPIALFAFVNATTLADARELRGTADRYGCELLELPGRREIEAECARRGWGLSREVVRELVPSAQAPTEPVSPPPLSVPTQPARHGRREWIASAGAFLVAGVCSLVLAAFWGAIALGVVAAITGWHPLGWNSDSESEPTLARAPDVRIGDEVIVPPDGKRPPAWVAVLRNRGTEAAVWARPQLTFTSDAGRVDVGRDEFAYPAVIPAGSRGLIVQPLHGADLETLEVRPGPISARTVDRDPRAPARVRIELLPTEGPGCKLVAEVSAKTSLERLRIWMLAAPSGKLPPALLQRRAGAVPAGHSRQLLDRFHGCPSELPEIRAFPAFGAGQLVE